MFYHSNGSSSTLVLLLLRNRKLFYWYCTRSGTILVRACVTIFCANEHLATFLDVWTIWLLATFLDVWTIWLLATFSNVSSFVTFIEILGCLKMLRCQHLRRSRKLVRSWERVYKEGRILESSESDRKSYFSVRVEDGYFVGESRGSCSY
jgi:hypothetical protein